MRAQGGGFFGCPRRELLHGSGVASIRSAPLTLVSGAGEDRPKEANRSSKEAGMLFQLTYTTRAGGSAKENEESARFTQALFAKWSPPPGMDIKSFYARADGRGGTVVLETDNVKALLDGPAKFGSINDFEIVPILDITEAVAIQIEAFDWIDSNS
jgi:hypothetical protein